MSPELQLQDLKIKKIELMLWQKANLTSRCTGAAFGGPVIFVVGPQYTMIISLLLIDTTVADDEHKYFALNEYELMGTEGGYYIDYKGSRITIPDRAFKSREKVANKEIFGNSEFYVTLTIGMMDESKPENYIRTKLNLNNIKAAQQVDSAEAATNG